MMQIKINSESDLYNPLDPTGMRINDSVYAYLKSFCTEAESEKHLHDKLQVISDGPVNADRLKRAIQEAVSKDEAEFDRQIAVNRKKALSCYIVGIVLSIIGITLWVLLDQVLLAFISFLGSTAISDGIVIQLQVNPDIRRLKKQLEPFNDFEVEVIQNRS